jgi:hypothetical protein
MEKPEEAKTHRTLIIKKFPSFFKYCDFKALFTDAGLPLPFKIEEKETKPGSKALLFEYQTKEMAEKA